MEIDCFSLVTEPANKLTMLITRDIIENNLLALFLRDGTISLTTINQNVITKFHSVLTRPFDPWHEEFNKVIIRLMSAGIFETIKETKWKLLKRADALEVPLLVLSMDHLLFGFEICGYLILSAFLTFFVEIFWWKLKIFVKRFCSFMAALIALKVLFT